MTSGSPASLQELVSEQPVLDVVGMIEVARDVVEPVHPDVVQQAPRPHQAEVNVQAGAWRSELLDDVPDDPAVRVDEVERAPRRRVLLMQDQDFLIGRNPHATAA